MPVYDYQCDDCKTVQLDKYKPITETVITCAACQGDMHRVWTNKAGGVIDDSIPGGLWIKHGLCNPDGSPKRYDSRTEIAKAANKLGVVNHVEHIGAKGSDKSRHTSRWV